MSASRAPAPGDDFNPPMPPEIEDLALAREGDAAALAKVRRQIRACLEGRIDSICHCLFRHSCLSEAAASGVPSSADALKGIMLIALDGAVFQWDTSANFAGFALRIAVTKGWREVARCFKDSACETVEEALASLAFPPGIRNPLAVRIPAIVESICTKAPLKWLLESPAHPAWQAFVLPEAEAELRAELGKLAREGDRWPIDPDLDARIVVLAGRLARRRGGADSSLKDALANAAREWVALLARAFGPSRKPTNAFLFVAAKNQMKLMLSITRSHNFALIVWLVEDARAALRERLGEEPTNGEIAAELDPEWARGERDDPRFSMTLIANVTALFVVESTAGGGDLHSAKLAFVLERLAVRARLTEEQTAVLKLFASGMSHEEIAAKRGITEARSRKLHHGAKLRIIVSARRLSFHEWTVLHLKVAEGKSHLQIAVKLGITESETQVLFHYAAEMIEMFPRFVMKLTQAERRALELGLFGGTHAGIAARLGLSRDVVAGLLKTGIGKIAYLRNEK